MDAINAGQAPQHAPVSTEPLSIGKDSETQPEPTQTATQGYYSNNELGNAQRLEVEFANKFVWTKQTDWLGYREGLWRRDDQRDVYKAMIYIVEVAAMSEDENTRKWGLKSGSSRAVNGSVALASSLKTFCRSYASFNQKPHLFNCSNGTYNLETGVFQAHNPKDLLTKGSAIKYDPDAKCPKFEKFLLDVMAGKENMRLFLQRACGYTMSAYTSEPVLLIPYGTGGTGKSQFLHVLRGILGSYAEVADTEMFMAKKGDVGQPFEMAGLDGVRALFASEVEDGKRLAHGKVKQMTGSDPIRACYKGKEAYTFVPQWKVWLACNDAPTVSAEDEAMWDRLKLIPFDVKFRGAETEVKDFAQVLLREESSGILNWFIGGYKMWREQGLSYPDEVREATAEWRGDEDYLARYLEEFTGHTEDQNQFVPKASLFAHFASWAKDSKEGRWITDKQFSKTMRRKGYSDRVIWQAGKSSRCWTNLTMTDRLAKFGSSMHHEPSTDDLLDSPDQYVNSVDFTKPRKPN